MAVVWADWGMVGIDVEHTEWLLFVRLELVCE
jgi:hypothetical protein